jgi:hypothetical protein
MLPSPQELAKARDRGFEDLQWARELRVKAIREFAGRHYGENPDDEQRVVNLIAQSGTVLSAHLTEERISHKISPKLASLRYESEKVRIMLDQLGEEMDLVEKDEELITDAILGGMGIQKLGLKAGQDSYKMDPVEVPRAEPYAENVSLDDYVCDGAAKHLRGVYFEGHRSRIARDEALQLVEDGIYGRDPEEYEEGEEPIEFLATREEAIQLINDCPRLGADGRGVQDPAEAISQDLDPKRFELVDTIELWDLVVYCSDGPKQVTMATGAGATKYLAVSDYPTPEMSPYHKLCFLKVPDNKMPMALVALWGDVHEAAKKVGNKIVRQIIKAKRNYVYRADQEDEAMATKKAMDQEFIKGDPAGIAAIDYGGVIKDLYPGVEWLTGQFNNASGNIQLLNGQGEISDTATEAQYAQGNAHKNVRRMQYKVRCFRRKRAKHLAWLKLSDPMMDEVLPYRMPGGKLVDLRLSAETREGDYLDYLYDIETDTSAQSDPAIETKRAVEMFGVLGQLMPFVQAGILDGLEIMRILSRRFGVEDLDKAILDPVMQQISQQIYGPMAAGGMGGQGQPGMGAGAPGMGPGPGSGAMGPPGMQLSPGAPRRPGGTSPIAMGAGARRVV